MKATFTDKIVGKEQVSLLNMKDLFINLVRLLGKYPTGAVEMGEDDGDDDTPYIRVRRAMAYKCMYRTTCYTGKEYGLVPLVKSVCADVGEHVVVEQMADDGTIWVYTMNCDGTVTIGDYDDLAGDLCVYVMKGGELRCAVTVIDDMSELDVPDDLFSDCDTVTNVTIESLPCSHLGIAIQPGMIRAVPEKIRRGETVSSRSAAPPGIGVVIGVGFNVGWMGTEKDPGPVNNPAVALALEGNGIMAKRPGGISNYPSAVFVRSGCEGTKDEITARASLMEAVTCLVTGDPKILPTEYADRIAKEFDSRWIVMSPARLNQLKADPYGTIYATLCHRRVIGS
jgi:hypothetical protein